MRGYLKQKRLKDNPKLYLILAGSDQGRTELSQSLLDLAQDLGVVDRVRLVRMVVVLAVDRAVYKVHHTLH